MSGLELVGSESVWVIESNTEKTCLLDLTVKSHPVFTNFLLLNNGQLIINRFKGKAVSIIYDR